MDLYKKVVRWLCILFESIAIVSFVTLIGFLIFQVVARYIFNFRTAWTDELSVQFINVICFVGMAMGVKEKIHTTIPIFVDRLHKKFRLAIEIIGKLFVMAMGGVLCFNTLSSLSMLRNNRLPVSGIPAIWVYIFSAAMFILIILISVYQIYDHFKSGTDEEQMHPEDFVK